ncbi:MAG: rhodanese-related sulfurtransferase [Pseudomonadota bacterium]|nr:rhodanese-related sulfurtransferase [Pseudomonadota bacterium]
MYTVAAFYHFASLDCDNLPNLQSTLETLCQEKDIKGTILLAQEGVNGTVSGYAKAIEALIKALRAIDGFSELAWKRAEANSQPFFRMKVRLKKEIVTLGRGDLDVANQTATKVGAEKWETLLNDPDCIVIDTRNTYETAIGQFKNATDPGTENFRDFPEYVAEKLAGDKKKKIAMYCTGGIRCEKASAYMKKAGFQSVYQLDGGILKYLEETKNKNAYWQGDCFVFDNRVAVQDNLEESTYKQCFGCRHPLTYAQMQLDSYREGVHCHRCVDQLTSDQTKRFSERQRQIKLAKSRGKQHIGVNQKEAI